MLIFVFSLESAFTQQTESRTVHVFRVQHKPVAELEPILRPLLPDSDAVRLMIDERANEFLVIGDDSIKRIVGQFLESVDVPDEARVDRPLDDELVIYRVPPELRRAIISTIQRRYDSNRVRVQEAPLADTFFVTAPPETHLEIDAWVNQTIVGWQADTRQNDDRVNLSNPNRGMADLQLPQRVSELSSFFPVRRELLDRTQEQIVALFSDRLMVDPDIDGGGFRLETQEGRLLRFKFDPVRQGVLVSGEENSVDQFGRLLLALSAADRNFGQGARVIRLRREAHQQLDGLLPNQQIDDLNQDQRGENPQAYGRTPRNGFGQQTQWQQAEANRSGNPTDPFVLENRQVSYQQGLANATNLIPTQDGGNPQDDGPSDVDQDEVLRQFEGVEIDSLPDFDVIILRGRDEELEQLAEIIRQLEQISQDTQSEVRIVTLRHTLATRMIDLVEQTNQALVGARQGRVTYTPLVKPNAILLVGWGDAVTVTIDLIRKLDVPVAPETQFEVFILRHTAASDMQQTVEGFLSGRDGLGPEILATVDARTNSLLVHAAPRDLAEVAALIDRLDVPQSGRVHQARIFPIQHSVASDVAVTLQSALDSATADGQGTGLELMIADESGRRLLRAGLLENIQVTVNARNNTLIVSGPEESFDLIAGLIEQLDSPGFTAKIKIYPIVNSDASSMVQTLRSLLPSQQGANPLPQLSTAPNEPSLAPLRFTVDVRSNSIIASGSEGDLRIVEALIIRLDEQGSMQRRTMVYQLKNSPAIDVALAVNEFLRNKRIVESAQPGEVNPFQQIEQEVVVVPEPVSNKLILSATPRYFEEISDLIEKLDEQPPEVVIQVLIAEVVLNDADEFGIELGLQDSVLFDRSLLGDLMTTTNSTQVTTMNGVTTITEELIRAATNTPGFLFNSTNPLGNSGSSLAIGNGNAVGGQGISNFGVSRTNSELGFGGLVLSASSQNVNVLIRALQESRRLEILSRPQIRTLDNQPAFIQVGQRVPRIVASTVNQNGQSNNVDLENVGLILGVTPRISPDGNVVMEIDAEKSNVGPEQEGVPVSVSLDGTIIRSPRVDTTTAQASVSAASGETIVLGGLITKSSQDIHRKVPVLGDIPILGNAFRFDSVINRRTELLIILTPQVIRSREDSERIKQTEIARMSWCAADVYNIHGDIDYVFLEDSMLGDGQSTQVIYPDQDPRGESSRRREEQPTPARVGEEPFMLRPTDGNANPLPPLRPSNGSATQQW